MRINSKLSFSVLLWTTISILSFSCKVQESTINIPNQKDREPGTLLIYVEENGKKVTKVIERSKVDSLDQTQLEVVNQYLSSINPSYPESNDFIFIKYHPGKDRSNSTGRMTRNEFGERDLVFKSEIQKRENITVSRVYKNDSGLKRFNKESTWYQDDNQTIEHTFFEYHYPGSSYVILHKSGQYFAWYGESYYLKHLSDIDLFQELVVSNKG